MTHSTPQQNLVQTKKHIIEIARKLFSEYTYLGVSMADIAKKLNITKAALYYHFTGKSEIYKKVLDEVFEGLLLSLKSALKDASPYKRAQKFIENYLKFCLKEKNLIKALMLKIPARDKEIKHYIIKKRKEIVELGKKVIEEVMEQKNIKSKIDIELMGCLLIGMMDGILLEYSFLNKKLDPEKISQKIVAIFL